MPSENGSADQHIDKVQALYNNYEILDKNKDEKEVRTRAYLEIIAAVRGLPQEKQLAAQFIPRFFKQFLELGERPVEAMLDLCEDEDVNIRKQAVKALPSICRDAPENVFKIADVLAQLSQSDDNLELGVVFNALVSIFSIDPKETIRGIFGQVQQNEQEIIRERCLKFMTAKMQVWIEGGSMTKEVEEVITQEARKCLPDLNANEFLILMSILAQTKLSKTVTGQQSLIDLVAEKMEVDVPLKTLDAENIDRLLRCLREALPFFSTQSNSDKYVHYLITMVFPFLDDIAAEISHLKIEIFKLFAELASFTSSDFATNHPEDLEAIYNAVVGLLVLPPQLKEGEEEESQKMGDDDGEPNLELSQIECMLYAFHRLLQHAPEFFKKEGEDKVEERLVDLRKRLTYLSRRVQVYIKTLQEKLKGKTAEELKREDNKIRLIALRTTANVNSLTRDFFHTPPVFRSFVVLSWKPASGSGVSGASGGGGGGGGGRHHPGAGKRKPIAFDEESNKHSGRPLYEPPGGKFSKRVDKYTGQFSGRGFRGGGGGGGRFHRGRRGGGGGYTRFNNRY
ncbi:unnamed protein product [Notodromas monacha]|uniref:Apoptosis inhibitor 5 n=2 Tax=Notodromas monacha TaxID=399045 RepID=A0A7R9BW26_9CRUS|nr:unnamed protein product [Notodromas monacha]CAG0921464.1 unnamed protein product [Notodromas monacha]